MTTVDAAFQAAAELARADSGLAVISTLRAGGTIQASVVNAAFLPAPLLPVPPGPPGPLVAFVTYGRVKLAHLRRRPQISVTVRAGWRWATVEGTASLVGPDDPHPAVDADRLRLLLREIFTAAGGTHDDWDAYDRVMAEQRRTAVFVTPSRIYGP
ncbi:TIGR03618 family F420-dependent PPOX class oxidoreductase [Parafrankia sp. FMc2]|uniref:TIGR03618 family F420-dependent PPOX class oxidoreductase n=1 Tax=Parafrankia sp. FMc2 TaxID=3233196 RepID=UPI0034D73822